MRRNTGQFPGRNHPMKQSAGLLIYRMRNNKPEVFLVHPGGPYWAKKDSAAWSIPKGEFATGDDPLQAALREFGEETGFVIPAGVPIPLVPITSSGYKQIHAWYIKGELDASAVN